MKRSRFTAAVPGGSLHGWVSEDAGPPVLLIHGGPGMSFQYLDGLAEEIGSGYRLAAYQQRGIAPSTVAGPFTVECEVADALAVLDALSWERAWIVGHSWGGHLLLHLALAAPERLSGGLAIEPLGGTGDGGAATFEAEMLRRIPDADRSLRSAWPAYFASPDRVIPFPDIELSAPACAGLRESLKRELPRLEAGLAGLAVPLGFVAGERSPMPHEEAADATAHAIPGAWVELVRGAGHFPWFERPGCVRSALQRLVRGASPGHPRLSRATRPASGR